MDQLVVIIVMALAPLGAWVAMGEGMVLEWFPKLARRLPKFLFKPLADCPRCMCSLWGIPAAFIVQPDLNPYMLPAYLLAAIGAQEVLHR